MIRKSITRTGLIATIFTLLMSSASYANIQIDGETRDIDGPIAIFNNEAGYVPSNKTELDTICNITITFEDGKKNYGSGTLIGQDTLVTSSLLFYEEKVHGNGAVYIEKADISDIKIDFGDTQFTDYSEIIISEEFSNKISNMSKTEDFVLTNDLAKDAFAFIQLKENYGLRAGFTTKMDIERDRDKHIMVKVDNNVTEYTVGEVEKGNDLIIYEESNFDSKYMTGAPAFTGVINSKGEPWGYVLAGINQGRHGKYGIITSIESENLLKVVNKNDFYTQLPDDFRDNGYIDTIEKIENGEIVYGVEGYNPKGTILNLGDVEDISDSDKAEYPFSPVCLITIQLKTPNGNEALLTTTGQLIGKNKILTCAHSFIKDEDELKDKLDKIDESVKESDTKVKKVVYLDEEEFYSGDEKLLGKKLKKTWELDCFDNMYVDFGYSSSLIGGTSMYDSYIVNTNKITVNSGYVKDNTAVMEKDLAVIVMEQNLGTKYGWYGLIEGITSGKEYSITGYPSNKNNTGKITKNVRLKANNGSFGPNIGIVDDMIWYNLETSNGVSGAGLKTKSSYDNDFRISSIHHGKVNINGDVYNVGCQIDREAIRWINGIK